MNHHNDLDNYSKLVANIPFLMSLKYKLSLFSKTNEKSQIDDILPIINKLNLQTKFLMEIENKPDFLIVKLERTRQLLNKLKKEISDRWTLILSKNTNSFLRLNKMLYKNILI